MKLFIKRCSREDCYYLCHQQYKLHDKVSWFVSKTPFNNGWERIYNTTVIEFRADEIICKRRTVYFTERFLKKELYKVLCKIPNNFRVLPDEILEAKDMYEYFKMRLL